jgi:hypothetical protein
MVATTPGVIAAIQTFGDRINLLVQWLSIIAVTIGKLVYLDRTTMLFCRHGRNESTVKEFNARSYFKNRNLIQRSLVFNILNRVEPAPKNRTGPDLVF